MFQTYSQNPNTGCYLRHNKMIHSSEVISMQFTVINKTQILHITASYEKIIYFQNRMEIKVGRHGSAGRHTCVGQAVVPVRQPRKKIL